MSFTQTARNTLIGLGIGIAALMTTGHAMAQSMVSVKGSTVNMRTRPTTASEIMWELKRGYPLKVLKRQGRWLQVTDFEGDRGWVARSLTGRTPYFVVKSKIANMRSGPGTKNRIVGKAQYGDLMRTLGKRSGWAHVQNADGKKGWISQKLLWGF
ncbi:MAG TPA: SH3 domain-containing protein [Hydrogenophaga sp.]